MSIKSKEIIVIGGPTASGKTALALKLAGEKDGVIINADSMQVYDGLSILTAQPSTEERQQAPHELYGYLHPNETCSAGNWRETVEPLIHDILKREQTPVVCGGSGLYIKSLVEGLSPMPDIPERIRKAASAKQEELGNPAFHAELEKQDPEMAARFHPSQTARLVRAWEVLKATGKSLAEWQTLPRLAPPDDWRFDITLVMPERDVLYDRCNRRLEWMLNHGALEQLAEFNAKIKSGEIDKKAQLTHALGVEPLTAYLEGRYSREEAIIRAQGETRRYAKRQVTWFRHQIKPTENVNLHLAE